MRRVCRLGSLLMLCGAALAGRASGQRVESAAQEPEPYRVRVAVDEVVLTMHAQDARGLPVNDLKADELKVLDNGKAPSKIVTFQATQDMPLRLGLVMDTSQSARGELGLNEAVALQTVKTLLRSQADKAFVMGFGKFPRVVQPWSSDAGALLSGVRGVGASGEARRAGTALFDTILSACLYQFGKLDGAGSGNVLLLFTDGEDNASYVYLKDAVDMCQRSNTAIYAYRPGSKPERTRRGRRRGRSC